MNNKNVITTTFDQFAKDLGGRKKSGSWYITRPDSVVVLHLQKSNYGPRYYLNFGLWFLGIGPAQDPKPTHCHLQTRWENLVSETDRPHLEALLDLDHSLMENERNHDLLEALKNWLVPFVDAGGTVSNLATPIGQRLLAKSLLDGDGQKFLSKIRESLTY
ncbi:DUF4304 domain-containing protein [Arthrobacter sp. NPDC056727]|uniref:DUF4304 domain-containing protein n=1 Tax=Arthrobacter sp. NPDC056727 TaxID=3345927 RepID=UPI00366DF0E0